MGKTQAEIFESVRALAEKHSKELIIHLVNNEGSNPLYDAQMFKMTTMDYLAIVTQYKRAILGETGEYASFQDCRIELLRKQLGGNIEPHFIPKEFQVSFRKKTIEVEAV